MADSQPTRATRLPETLDERYTEFRDERGMTNSEALRALIRSGLEVETADEEYVEQVLGAAHDAVEITTTARDVTEVMLQSDVDHHPVRLRTVLEDEVEDVRSNYDSALVRLDGPLPAVEVMADDMLASVFRNLLTNAIQHNDKEIPEVTVSAASDDGRVLATDRAREL